MELKGRKIICSDNKSRMNPDGTVCTISGMSSTSGREQMRPMPDALLAFACVTLKFGEPYSGRKHSFFSILCVVVGKSSCGISFALCTSGLIVVSVGQMSMANPVLGYCIDRWIYDPIVIETQPAIWHIQVYSVQIPHSIDISARLILVAYRRASI